MPGPRSCLLTSHTGLDTTVELLGLDDAQAVPKLAANGDGRAQVIMLALDAACSTRRPTR
jgi:hypothetical protein